jgi:hypothetical protein
MSSPSHPPAARRPGGRRVALFAATLLLVLSAGCATRGTSPGATVTTATTTAPAISPAPAAGSPVAPALPVIVREATAPQAGASSPPASGSGAVLRGEASPPALPVLIAPGSPAAVATPQGAPAGPPFDAGGALTLEAGLYRCELDRRVIVRRVAADGRSLVLNWRGRDSVLHAVQARTGALRFENPESGHVWLVIVGKSMLLDARAGRTLANECRL